MKTPCADERISTPVQKSDPLQEIVGCSRLIWNLKQEILRVAKLDIPVILEGGSGSGKELVAQLLHRLGRDGTRLVALLFPGGSHSVCCRKIPC